MSSKKRPRDQSLIDVYRQSAAIAIVVDEECDSKALPTNSAAKPIDDKLVEGNDVNQTKDNLYKNSELVDVASSFHAVGTGDAKYSLPRCPPAIVSSARSAVREKYISLQHTESCDKAIVSVFGVSG